MGTILICSLGAVWIKSGEDLWKRHSAFTLPGMFQTDREIESAVIQGPKFGPPAIWSAS